MAIVNTNYVAKAGVSSGYVDEYKTLVKADVKFKCGCGESIRVTARKHKTKKEDWCFVIKHRNRQMKVVNNYPTETQIFDRMLKVSTYASCRFPVGSGRRIR